MQAGPLNLKTLFGQERRHVVPLYQRPYVWNREDQWEPLWADVTKVADRQLAGKELQAHFLGAVVLEKLDRPTGHVETKVVIDGQQRLTTLQVLLQALSDICKATGQEPHRRAFEKLTRNEDPLSSAPDETFKVWPTTLDQDHFRRVMTAGSLDGLSAAYDGDPDSLLADAYLYFFEAALGWLGQTPGQMEKRTAALFEALARGVRVVVIDLERDDDAQVIFESLNARGTALLPADLVKNFLLRKAETEGEDVEAVYKKHWSAFDHEARYWRQRRGTGHARRARIDTFLQHYLTARLAEEVVTTHLFAAYREYAESSSVKSAVMELATVARYARTYRGFEEFPEDSREAAFFSRLAVVEALTIYPLLLELFDPDRNFTKAQRNECLSDLESFLVRRMVCGLSTRGYNRLVIDLLVALKAQKDGPRAALRSVLLGSDAESRRWPDDKEFHTTWTGSHFDKRQPRTRMVLLAIETTLRGPKTEPIKFKKVPSVEHILPRKWRKHWPLPDGLDEKAHEAAEDARDEILHTVGNLTLLTSALNSAQQNGPWSEKREQLDRKSILALNLDLRAESQWDEARIAARSETLFGIARKLWPHPSA